jgi:hypothetical protein
MTSINGVMLISAKGPSPPLPALIAIAMFS